MAKRNLAWSLEGDRMSVKGIERKDIEIIFIFDDIENYVPLTCPTAFHCFRHGIKQLVADTVSGMNPKAPEKPWSDRKVMDTMINKWMDLCEGKFTTRAPAEEVISVKDLALMVEAKTQELTALGLTPEAALVYVNNLMADIKEKAKK